jgi:hypothetical protein
MCIRRNKRVEEEADPWETRQTPPAPSQQRPTPEGDLGVRLRAEMLPASHASPRFKAYPRRQITTRRVVTLFVVLALAGLGWYFGIGPGRPGLERGLVSLVQLARQVAMPTSTPLPTDTPIPPLPSTTSTPTATLRPTTSTTPVLPTETPTVAPTETPESTCRDFSTVTLEDVGQEMCVQGTVIEVIENISDTLIIFSYEAGSLYLVTYDVAWPDATEGTCYQATGEIQRLLSSPVIVFGYNNLPTECP